MHPIVGSDWSVYDMRRRFARDPQGAFVNRRLRVQLRTVERQSQAHARSRRGRHSDHDHLIDMKSGKVVEFVLPGLADFLKCGSVHPVSSLST